MTTSASITRDALALITTARSDMTSTEKLLQAIAEIGVREGESIRQALERQALLVMTLASFAAEALDELGRGHPELVDTLLQQMALRVAQAEEEK